jgi:hypothetical protein
MPNENSHLFNKIGLSVLLQKVMGKWILFDFDKSKQSSTMIFIAKSSSTAGSLRASFVLEQLRKTRKRGKTFFFIGGGFFDGLYPSPKAQPKISRELR